MFYSSINTLKIVAFDLVSWLFCCGKMIWIPPLCSPGASEVQQQEGRTGGQRENQFGKPPVQCAFIPSIPCPLHPGCPNPSAGFSEPEQAALWEPLLHRRFKRSVFFSEMCCSPPTTNSLTLEKSFSLIYVPVDETEEEFSDDQPLRLPPVGPPSWDSNVVCIQPTRNPSRPEGHEESEENNNVSLSVQFGSCES